MTVDEIKALQEEANLIPDRIQSIRETLDIISIKLNMEVLEPERKELYEELQMILTSSLTMLESNCGPEFLNIMQNILSESGVLG